MIIECSNCGKPYKALESQIPKDRIVTFMCKGCGTKLKIDPEKIRPGIDTLKAVPADVSGEERTEPPGKQGQKLKNRIAASIEKLPAFPQVVFKVQEFISNPDSHAKEIAREIETDQALAAKVLRIANSAYYGMAGKISSIQHASVVLGYKTLGEIVTVAGAEGMLDGKLPGYGYDTRDLWEHSLAVALSSKIIAEMKAPQLVSEAYTAGLIHDIGKIILDPYITAKKEEFTDFMEIEEKTFLTAEEHFFSFNHADIAYEVCKKWNFPENIGNAIRYHHAPSGSDGNTLSFILHLADQSARMSGAGYEEDDYLYEIESGAMDFLDISYDEANNVTMETTEAMSQFTS